MLRHAMLALAVTAFAPQAYAQAIRGFYVGGSLGYSTQANGNYPIAPSPDTNLAPPNTRLNTTWDPGFVGALAIGFGTVQFPFRVELEGNYRRYRQNRTDSLIFARHFTDGGGSAGTLGVMINGLFDLDLRRLGAAWPVVAYAGAGTGYAWRRLEGVGGSVTGNRLVISDNTGGVVYQAMAGFYSDLDWAGLPRWLIGLEYRYVIDGTGWLRARTTGPTGLRTEQRADIASHSNNVMLTLRYGFWNRGRLPSAAIDSPPPPASASYQVQFGIGDATVGARGQSVLDRLAQSATGRHGRRLEVAGYADRSGSPTANLALSQRRARAVAAELMRRGVPPEAIVVRAYGDTRAQARTAEADGRASAQDRRVDIVLH